MKKSGGVSSEASKKATGYGWDEWLSILDAAGAEDWTHKQIVAFLKENYGISPWWQQTVTVAYEKAKGRRVVGQTADTGFQVGVQKTMPLSPDDAWALLSSRKGIACWLGKASRFSLAEGKRYSTDTGIEGEVRVVKPNDRIRLTWQRPDMERPATLQIALIETNRGTTSVRVHLEHLPSQDYREESRSHWKEVLERLEKMAATS